MKTYLLSINTLPGMLVLYQYYNDAFSKYIGPLVTFVASRRIFLSINVQVNGTDNVKLFMY